MSRKILLVTDFSEASEHAVRHASAIAARDRAAVGVCHVLPGLPSANPTIPAWLQRHLPDQDDSERRAREALASCAAALAAAGAPQTETFLERGDVVPAILKCADAFSADLVVAGSHGRTGLGRMLLGSVAEKLVRHAHRPVLVARPGPDTGPVITSTDFSEAGNVGLRAAAEEAARTGSLLVAIHVINAEYPIGVPYGPDALGIAAALSTTVEFRAVLTELRHAADSAAGPLGVQVTCEVGIGDAAAWIVRRAEDLAARLVALSTHGRTGMSRVLLGSVAEKVVRHAHVSVLAVRGAGGSTQEEARESRP